MAVIAEAPPLPGGTAASRLRVYTWPTPDGLAGGTPHLHLACSEAYLVIGGAGAVQTLTLAEGFRETPLRDGDLLWFTPGTIHRLINHDGELDIVVLMQNSGLPEAGDAVFTFPPETLADPDAYAAAAALPAAAPPADAEAAARRRRDLAIEGFAGLRVAAAAGDQAPLRAFHRRAAALVRPHLDAWRARFQAGPAAAVAETDAVLSALSAGDTSHLAGARVTGGDPEPRLGMCGWLSAYQTT